MTQKRTTVRLIKLRCLFSIMFVSAMYGLAMAECTISTSAVSFGTYNVFDTSSLDTTGSVTFNCTDNANITIKLDKGGAATFNPRRLLNGSVQLNYNLYTDAARTTIWGDGSGGTSFYSNPSTPQNQNVTVTVYGRIPARQDVSAGSYANAVVATVNW
jgi:spore coat protein U domain-containing protein, fimbrial subunit CupE1/2/3/6